MYSAALARLLKKANPANATTSNTPRPMASRVALPSFKVFSLLIGLNFNRFIVFWRLFSRAFLTVKVKKILSQLQRHHVRQDGYSRFRTEDFRFQIDRAKNNLQRTSWEGGKRPDWDQYQPS